jgi:hypothetical protein
MPTYQVFYARQPTFYPSGVLGTPRIATADLQATHIHLCNIEVGNLDDAWQHMQAEQWSPNGEARPLIERLGLRHTSMSVGDVIRDEGGTYWECLDLGWRRVEDETETTERNAT